MEAKKYYLAIDIGASSGRHIIGWMENKKIFTKEVYRFENGVKSVGGHLTWDIQQIFEEIKTGLRIAFRQYPLIESMSIDTWGADYVLMNNDQEILPCYAYRDNRTADLIDEVHKKITFSELYRRTGSQFQPFNSIYQLSDDLRCGRLTSATDFLMIPEYFLYKLTGKKIKEYTNATTTGLIHAHTGQFDHEITQRLGLPSYLFPKLVHPGMNLGFLRSEIAEEIGGTCSVVVCATHDTASAVEGIAMADNAPYISSGTWSLLGVKTPSPLTDSGSEIANYSNEGGIGYNRYQKNIMGLWLIQCLQKELCPHADFTEITHAAEASTFDGLVNADAPEYLRPDSMVAAFDHALGHITMEPADYFRCALRSLAQSYAKAINELEKNTATTYHQIYIVGGGAKNQFLNRLTEAATGKTVIALPIEATAIGNLKIQMEEHV